jgi:hypothetical protein
VESAARPNDASAQGDNTTDALNWLGLIGLLGLAGLRRGHDEDSYHPAPID